MSDNALTMSLAEIIKKGKQSRSQKSGRGGTKSGFRTNNKKQNFPVQARGRPGGRGGISRNNNKNFQRGVVAYRGKGVVRGRNRASLGRFAMRGKQQFKRIPNKTNVKSARKGQSGVNSVRLVQRTQRFTAGDRYFNKSPRNAWKNKNTASTIVEAKATNKLRIDGNFRNKGKRTVQKLAQKRIRSAKLMLAGRQPIGRNPKKVQMGVSGGIRKGIRRSKFGFVTIRSQNEKRIEQLNIQQKISRASRARSRQSNNGKQLWTENSAKVPSNRIRNKGRSQVSMSNNLVQVRIPNDYRPQFEVRNNLPAQSSAMYPGDSTYGPAHYAYDNMGSDMPDMMWSPPQMRNQSLRQGYGDSHGFDMNRATLDPEIQRRISFIQSRTVGHNPSVLPDFKAPVSTSRMKLSDRFRMIMH